eukprot:GHVL01036752.1.p1 GENE.GHVL01036752.1~~GHVL01036752.1.p1  ORF type:complete len:334 (-),score=50.28 GHVL01036752.1:681-1682(-)
MNILSKNTKIINNLTFSSDFDSGNAANFEFIDGEYHVWVAPDSNSRIRAWFYFKIDGLSRDSIISIVMRELTNQHKLYDIGMRPVYRFVPHRPQFEHISNNVSYDDTNGFNLRFKISVPYDNSTLYIAFSWPYSVSDLNIYLNELDRLFLPAEEKKDMKPTKDMQPNKDIACGASSGFPIYWGPNLPDPEGSHNIYYTRQLLCNSLEKRRIDLLTITATQESVSDTGEKESSPIGFSDEFLKDPPWKFPNRQIIFVSSRVHPGEITSQFVLLGFMNFILSGDERAKSLRKLFVFKIVPMVNPDGVSIGHYRLNSVGLNLNRYYDRPNTVSYKK